MNRVPAVMITDTPLYRNPNYHNAGDTIATLDFARMGWLLPGLRKAVEDLCSDWPPVKEIPFMG